MFILILLWCKICNLIGFTQLIVLCSVQFVAAGDHLVHHCPTWKWQERAHTSTCLLGYLKGDIHRLLLYLYTASYKTYIVSLRLDTQCLMHVAHKTGNNFFCERKSLNLIGWLLQVFCEPSVWRSLMVHQETKPCLLQKFRYSSNERFRAATEHWIWKKFTA